MAPDFSSKPGRSERHLQRKYNNPLFPAAARSVSQDQIVAARALDEKEFKKFSTDFNTILQEFIGLKKNEDSEIILALKQRLDQLYEQVCGLGGDRSKEKEGLTKLHQAVNQSIAAGAAGDANAEEKLAEEAQARNTHWQLLEEPMVADLLWPDSPISQDDMVPSLLSTDANSFSVTMGMFDDDQQRSLLTQAEKLVLDCDQDSDLDNARACIKLLQELVANDG